MSQVLTGPILLVETRPTWESPSASAFLDRSIDIARETQRPVQVWLVNNASLMAACKDPRWDELARSATLCVHEESWRQRGAGELGHGFRTGTNAEFVRTLMSEGAMVIWH